jgi:hypothetical protein
MRSEMARAASWWSYVVWFYAMQLWRSLPGPWPVKVLLLVATQAIPGPLDEIALLAVTGAFRKWRARRLAVAA